MVRNVKHQSLKEFWSGYEKKFVFIGDVEKNILNNVEKNQVRLSESKRF